MQKISLILTDDLGQRLAIDHMVDEQLALRVRVPTITIRVGDQSITLPRAKFAALLRDVTLAEQAGLHPDDVNDWLQQ